MSMEKVPRYTRKSNNGVPGIISCIVTHKRTERRISDIQEKAIYAAHTELHSSY
jgi:hypothetical protein